MGLGADDLSSIDANLGSVKAGRVANDNRLTPTAWERIEGALERTRERIPSLTTGLLIAVFLLGGGLGAMASKPFHRAEINKEWRGRIASKSKAVRDVIAQGDADAEATDNAIIATLGEYDARLSTAEQAVKTAGRPSANDPCSIPADRLR